MASPTATVDLNNSNPMVELHDDDDSTIDTDKLSYEIFSILETDFLFGYDDEQNGVAHSIKAHRGKICVLSVDGGACGTRSFLSAKTLSYLETALKDKSGNPDARIADYFDVAAGTGVGGIFTAMLFASGDRGRPIFRAEDTWKFLDKFSAPAARARKGGGFLKGFLNRSAASSCADLEKAMKEAFKDERTGRDLTLKDTLKPILIPCYDLSTAAPFLFSRADALETDSYDFNLWEVCLATSAQPADFAPVRMKSVDGAIRCVGVDGGLTMSNPTAAAITHVLHNKQEFPFVRGVEDILVLSLGLGGHLLEGGFDFDQINKWKAKDWARPLARISCDSSAEVVDHAVAIAFGQSHRSNYVRIQANGLGLGWGGSKVDMDATPSNVKTLIEHADEMLKQRNVESVMFNEKRIGEETNLEKLDWFAAQLVLEHRRRSCRVAPTVAFKQAAASNPSSHSEQVNIP